MMKPLAFFKAYAQPLTLNSQDILLNLDYNRFRLHSGQFGGKHIGLRGFVYVHCRGPGYMTVLHAWLLRNYVVKKGGKLPLGLRQLPHGAPVIVMMLHEFSSCHDMRQKVSRYKAMSRAERTLSDI